MNAIVVSEVVASVLILLGALLSFISAIGLIRFPDVYSRSHATTKGASLGVLSVLAGTFLYLLIAHGYVSIKILLGIFFVFFTTPTAGHLVCRAAYRTNVEIVTDPYANNGKQAPQQSES